MSDRGDPDQAVRWRHGQLAEVRNLGETLPLTPTTDSRACHSCGR
jgi:hypothetical protein